MCLHTTSPRALPLRCSSKVTVNTRWAGRKRRLWDSGGHSVGRPRSHSQKATVQGCKSVLRLLVRLLLPLRLSPWQHSSTAQTHCELEQSKLEWGEMGTNPSICLLLPKFLLIPGNESSQSTWLGALQSVFGVDCQSWTWQLLLLGVGRAGHRRLLRALPGTHHSKSM